MEPTPPPEALAAAREFLGEPHPVPVHSGWSGARLYRLAARDGPALYLKVAGTAQREELRDERRRLEWLAGRLPVPRVVAFAAPTGGEAWLLTTEVPGLPASEPRWAANPAALARSVGRILRRIHALPVRGCPFAPTLRERVEAGRRRIAAGLVEETDFDEPRQRRTALELHRELVAGLPEMEACQERVFTHGDYCLPNILLSVHPEAGEQSPCLSGLVDWGRAAVADRYQDLALALRSLHYNLGAGLEQEFLAAYGLDPPRADAARVRYYQTLDELF